MKRKHLIFAVSMLCALLMNTTALAQNYKQTPTYVSGPPQRTCGTEIPSQQWEELFQKQIAAFLAANPQINSAARQSGGNSTQAVYTIPVIIHVIHGGQAVGTFPNLAQGQLNSQVQVLNDDFSGVGYNVGNYPANAFTTWATNTIVSAASKDGSGRIKISNTGITFCLALKDSLGNTLAEPGIDRVNYNNITAPLTGTFTSKNPAAAVYNTSGKFQGFIDGYIKPNTIWNVSKYMNLWVTDEQSVVGLLGYATFPVLSTLTGIPGATGTNKTDGFWAYAAAFGSKALFPGGTYSTGYDLGRTCTHEIGHWVGLRHIWGDGTCLTDYCNDTPPAAAANFVNCPTTYPYHSGTCAGPPSNSPNGEMFMNFMDYSYDCAMFMFTEDQRTRIQTAMANSPYRKFLGTHGLCSIPPPVANFSFTPNPACIGQTISITDMSTGSAGAWSYTMTGGAPSTSTLQNPSVTYTAAGVYSITLVASNGGGNSTPVVKTVTINAAPVLTITPAASSICAGGSATLTASGASTYTWSTGSNSASIVVSPTVNTTYTVTGANGSCTNTKTVSVTITGTPTVNIFTAASTTICSGNTSTLTGTGATNYTWMPGGMTTTIVAVTPTATTIYTLTGSNGGSCTGTKTIQITVNTTPTIAIIASPTAICSGNSATLTASGATSYTWNTGATTAVIVVTPTTTTNYTVVGVNGTCASSKTISLIVTPGPSAPTAGSNSPLCSGSTLSLTASTIPGATYSWTGPNSFTASAQNTTIPGATTLAAGTYSVRVTVGGCTSGYAITNVVVNALPSVTVTSNPLTICPGSTATLTAIASGAGPFTYSWSTGATSASITSSLVGVYTATVTSAAGCKASQSYSLNAAAGLTINATTSSTAICAGNSATLSATGATTYTWMPGSLTGANVVVTPTTNTTYTVNGTSGTCTGSQTISIVVNANPTVAVTATPTSVCAGSTSTLTATGASTYSWSTGGTTSAIVVTPTATTTYTVIGTTGSCSNTKTISVNTLVAPTITVTANPISICPGATSTLTANGTGGPGPFTYSWSTGATTAVITTSVAGVYTSTFTNGNGCKASQSVTVSTAPGLSVTVSASPSSLCGGGSSTLTASGATTYTWMPGSLSGANVVVTPTISTTYTVNGTSGSCTGSQTVSISVNPNPTVAVVASPTSICSGSTVSLVATGASTYSWSTGGTGTSISVTPTVTTTYTVIGSNGSCSNTKTVQVVVNTSPTISASSSASVICSGNSSTLTASGATTYTWSTGSNAASIVVTPTSTTTYTVVGTSGSCTGSQIISVTVNSNPTVAVVASPTAICAGGSASLIATGASTYSWSTGGTGSSIGVTPSVTTTYSVIGANGSCINTNTVQVVVNTTPFIATTSSSSLICAGQSATLISTGATNYTYNPGAITGNPIAVSPTVTTTYIITGNNGAGCTGTTSIVQNVSPCTGITTISAVDVMFGVYPNPNNGEFTLTCGQVSENIYLEIYNNIGQLISKQMIKENETKVNLTEQADGIYHLRIIKEGNQLYKSKVIKD
jgi:hypothetical protein